MKKVNCVYFCYMRNCYKPYLEEKKKYGYGDLTKHICVELQKHPTNNKYLTCKYKTTSLWQKIKLWWNLR